MVIERSPLHYHDVVDKQVDDLRERMRLLQQDRRANIDLLEANNVTNTTEIRELKEKNRKLRSRLSSLQKSAAANDETQGDVNGLKKLVLVKRNDYDAHKSSVIKMSSNLNKLKDEYQILSRLEDKHNSTEKGPASRQIQLLENRLDHAMIQYNEAQGICSTYDHIVKRLKDERISFDNQLTALERTLQSKERDYEELLLLSGDASHSREVALQNLQKEKIAFEDNKAIRVRDIRDRQQNLRIRKQMIEKQDRSDVERRKAPEVTDSVADVSALFDSLIAPAPIDNRDKSQVHIEDQDSTLGIYETAFRKIKDATGVSNANEVIRKIVGQESTTESLCSQSDQNQSKIEELTSLHESLARKVDTIKFNVSNISKCAKPFDEKQELHSTRSNRYERTKNQFDRLALVVLSVKAGMEHIRDMLGDLPDEFDIDFPVVTEQSVPDAIRSCGDLLMEAQTKARENELGRDLDAQDLRATELNKLASHVLMARRPATSGVTAVQSFNQRISLPSAHDVAVFDHERIDELVYGELDNAEEEITRDGIKRSSSNIIATEERRKIRSSRKPEES